MGRLFRKTDEQDETCIPDAPLLDSEFDETVIAMSDDYERVLLASIQPHHFQPSSRN